MSEYSFVEKPFLDQLAALGWTVIDQGPGIPTEPAKSLRTSFREVSLREVLNHLYTHPIVTPNEVAKLLQTTHQTANTLIHDFESLGILEKSFKLERSQAYIFRRYLDLFLS
jgi:type I restriction enzyme R subunit